MFAIIIFDGTSETIYGMYPSLMSANAAYMWIDRMDSCSYTIRKVN